MGAALLSRFDLVLLLTDVPNDKRDRDIAQHVVKAHAIGEGLAQHEHGISRNKPDMTWIEPPIEPVLLRKYIAYAKKHIIPKMTREVKTALENNYCRIRGLGGENKPVPVTVRQIEALVRLAEASAKMRLSNDVEMYDANLAIELFNACLKGIAYDPETGVWDADAIETGTKKETRDLSLQIKQAVERFADEHGRARLDAVISSLAHTLPEKDKVERMIEAMERSGELMQPKHGVVKLI